MKKILFFGAMLTLAACATPPQTAQTNFTYTRTAASNTPLEVSNEYSINPDCSNLGYATIRITSQPTNGRVALVRGTTFPRFAAENPRFHCNTKRVPSVNVTYTSNPGYKGQETFSVDIIYASGNVRQITYVIDVR